MDGVKIDVSRTRVESEPKRLPFWRIGIFGMGNFASNLSWTMVSTYLALFYTDTIGLTAGAVSILLLLTRIWDAINDPMMGRIMEKTRSRWGRFRPYILFGAPLLAIATVFTFRNPGLSYTGNLIYAVVTYTLLGMIYTAVNVPYGAMPMVITRNRDDLPRLGMANMVGMNAAMILLNMCTLPLITYFGGGSDSRGYQITATVYAVVALLLFWIVFAGTKEVITPKKEDTVSFMAAVKMILTTKNILCCLLQSTLSMVGIMGRIGIAVYYYIHVVGQPNLVGIFMSMQMIVAIVVAPFAPKVSRVLGRKRAVIMGQCLHIVGLVMMLLGNSTNIPYLIIAHIVYGSGYLGGMSGSGLLRDAVDANELKTGKRIDGTVAGFSGLAGKTGSAIGSSLGLAVMGLTGYVGGGEITAGVSNGINLAVNLVPLICICLSVIPLFFYDLNEDKAKEMHAQLEARRSAQMAIDAENNAKHN